VSNPVNQSVYQLYAPIYDWLFGAVMKKARQRSVEFLCLRPGDHLLIPGIGTGLDLAYIPAGVQVIGTDISPAMLSEAKKKPCEGLKLMEMDAQTLQFPDRSFDAVLLNLILSVVPDGKQTLQEAWRVLRPGGRIVLFDKFLPDGAKLTFSRGLLGGLIRLLGTDPNRRLVDLLCEIPDMVISADEPVLLGGQYRVILLNKPGEDVLRRV
jgi:ubiquinone/menaquinone biosynthesis C-methylase UbiE